MMAQNAKGASWYRSKIVGQQEVAAQTYRIRVACPEIAARALPGQFVMIRIAGCNDPLIGRALAIFERVRDSRGDFLAIDLVYVAKGKLTTRLSLLQSGQEVELWGPLGNSFSTDAVDHLVLVAGGVGETPMLTLGREALGLESFASDRPNGYAKRVTLCYGARTSSLLACVDDFSRSQFDVRLSTDDGSIGSKQVVTETLKQVLAEEQGSLRIACCGPERMMEAVSQIAKDHGIPCEVSLETPMACGIGICFTCVARICENDSWDYRRTCIEGPIFDARRVVW